MDTIESLVENLTRDTYEKQDKVEKIFNWITLNIEYDTETYMYLKEKMRKYYYEDDLQEIFIKKKALCSGYAKLFQAMCRLCNIACEIIKGYSKAYGYVVGDKFKDTPPNHQWNCVQLRGEWKLVDCCWGAGYIDGKNRHFVSSQRTLYFLTDPQVFIKDHFPMESRWQLLDTPVSINQFEIMPHTKYGFYIHKVNYGSSNLGVIKCHRDCSIKLLFEKRLDIIYEIIPVSKVKQYNRFNACTVHYQQENNAVKFHLKMSEPAQYMFTAYGKSAGVQSQSFASVISYLIDNTEANPFSTLTEFSHMPWGPCKSFYSLGLEQSLPISTKISVKSNQPVTYLEYENKKQLVQLKGTLYQVKDNASSLIKLHNYAFTNRSSDGKLSVHLRTPTTGNFLLLLHARLNSNSSFQTIAKYWIESCQTSPLSYPIMTKHWLQGFNSLLFPNLSMDPHARNKSLTLQILDAIDVILLFPNNKVLRLHAMKANIWTIELSSDKQMSFPIKLFVKSRTDSMYRKYLEFKGI